MAKGVEISFQVNDSREEEKTVAELANLTGNIINAESQIQWRIFHVTLGDQKFYKVLFSGPKVTRLHPELERKIRERFDTLSRMPIGELSAMYTEKRKSPDFRVEAIQDLKEEYDLWQDKFWQYF